MSNKEVNNVITDEQVAVAALQTIYKQNYKKMIENLSPLEQYVTEALLYLYEITRETGKQYLREKDLKGSEDEVRINSVTNTQLAISDIEDYLDPMLIKYYIENIDKEGNATDIMAFATKTIENVLFSDMFYGYMINQGVTPETYEEMSEIEKINYDALREMVENRLIFVAEDMYTLHLLANENRRKNIFETIKLDGIEYIKSEIETGSGKLTMYYKTPYKEINFDIPLDEVFENMFAVEVNDELPDKEKYRKIALFLSFKILTHLMMLTEKKDKDINLEDNESNKINK